MPAARLRVGDRLTVRVGEPAHGGSCVARHGRAVVFVRHALPGELVEVSVTHVRSKVAEADCVAVLERAPERVEPACPVAGPGLCGGCDLQHVAAEAQLRWKSSVVRQQLQRIAGIAVDVPVLAVGDSNLRWRTRTRFSVRQDGTPGLHRHHSHEVLPLADCPITHADAALVLAERWPGLASVELVRSSTGERSLVLDGPFDRDVAKSARAVDADSALTGVADVGGRRLAGRAHVRETAAGRDFRVGAAGFWQVHPAAADMLARTVADLAAAEPGQVAWDLYAGVGLFAAVLAAGVGPGGRVVAVEADARAVSDARRNLHDLPVVEIRQGRVEHVLGDLADRPDLVVLDPPRAGAGLGVCTALAQAGPARVVYVACDPAAMARDIGEFVKRGYRLETIVGYDLFPMTHHVECVALLVRAV
jgi:tRNA/tmRNA/rRNA uracil-C5-methylase (TrmA/RlmC/RlmD family)